MEWNIVCDSSCDLRSEIGETDILYSKVPFVISSGEADFTDDNTLSVPDMLARVERETAITHTSCPTPMSWYDKFRSGDNIIAITISKALSGSYNSAMVAKKMILEECPDKNIAVINSNGTSGSAVILVEEIVGMINRRFEPDQIIHRAEELVKDVKIIFSLCSFDNLIKNGRMKKITGKIASKLGFWGMGIGDKTGNILILDKVRGTKCMLQKLIANIEERGIPKSKLIISHCLNAPLANELKLLIKKKWKNIDVRIMETSGINSYYAERGGLIVGYI